MAPDDAQGAFIADIERCMRGMKACGWEWSERNVTGFAHGLHAKHVPLPKRGEDPWLDACCKRACE